MSTKTDNYGSEYLYSEDLLYRQEYKTVSLEIEDVIPPGTRKTAAGELVNKWCLKFVGKEKLLVLCKTNASIIHHIAGDAPGPSWIGKKITLQVRIVDSFGAKVCAIRVMPPDGCMIRKKLIERLGTKAVWKGATE